MNEPGGPAGGSQIDRALLLRDVMEHSVKAQQEQAKPNVRTRSRAGAILGGALCVPLLVVCAYSWVARPEFIWGPQGQALMSPERTEANMRVAMFLIAQRLEMYRAAQGAYPASLGEIGADTTFAFALRDDAGYQLSGRANGKQIILVSTDNMDAFLGNSHNQIQQKPSR